MGPPALSPMTEAVRRFPRSARALVLALAVVAAVPAAGCFHYDERIEARADGTGTMTFRYRLPLLLLSFAGRGDPNALLPLSFDEKELRDLLDAARLRASKLVVADREGERHVEIVVELDSIEDIARLPRIRGHEIRFASDEETGDFCLRRSISLGAAPVGAGPLAWLALELACLRFECRLPWRVRETNADSRSGGVLVWERRLSDLAHEPFVMSARVAAPSILDWAAGRPWVVGAIASMALAGAGFAAARRRRRPGPTAPAPDA